MRSDSQDRLYRCKYCNATNTRYDAMTSELSCRECGSIAKVTSKDLDKLEIEETTTDTPDLKNMSKIERMKTLVHLQDSDLTSESVCGISKSGKFSDIEFTRNIKQATCRKCTRNA